METLGKLSLGARVMVVVSVLSLFVGISTTATTRHNGELTSCTYLDYWAMVVGVLSLLAGLDSLRRGLRPSGVIEEQVTRWHLAIGAVLVMLAVVHGLRGFGVVGGPCH